MGTINNNPVPIDSTSHFDLRDETLYILLSFRSKKPYRTKFTSF